MATLHYASNGTAAEVTPFGFNLIDVSSVRAVNALPAGTKGLVWLNEWNGVTSTFINKVTPFIGNPKVFGFYLVDGPDPTGKYGEKASPANLMAETDWIHERMPGAKTFIFMMNMSSSKTPSFMNTYNPENSHIDLYGLGPYPVRTEHVVDDYSLIDRTVGAAVAAGIPISKIVPLFQAFGGGAWRTDTGGSYEMPTPEKMRIMLARWANLVPSPVFDYAYSWGSQNDDVALENSPELQAVFRERNLAVDPPPPSGDLDAVKASIATLTTEVARLGTEVTRLDARLDEISGAASD
jgi:hypothetical protein